MISLGGGTCEGGDDERWVCANCFDDRALQKLVRFVGTRGKCSFCEKGARPRKVATVSTVAAFIAGCFNHWFDQPEETLLLDPDGETPFAGDVSYAWDIIADWVRLADDGGDLYTALVNHLRDQWWCTDPGFDTEREQGEIEREVERLHSAWMLFCRLVANHSRYLFQREAVLPVTVRGARALPVRPTRMLHEVGHAVRLAKLFKNVPAGTVLYRARVVTRGDEPYTTAEQLGPPRRKFCRQPNRMSAAGIPMFYGALDRSTAIEETVEAPSRVTTAAFKVLRPLILLDLTAVPEKHEWSIFENVAAAEPVLHKFLAGFRDAISAPIARDGREHVDYVPSQIVTEYFRYGFGLPRGARLDGIIYPSSKITDGACVTLFCDCWGVREIEHENGSRPKDVEAILSFDAESLECRHVEHARAPSKASAVGSATQPDDNPLSTYLDQPGFEIVPLAELEDNEEEMLF